MSTYLATFYFSRIIVAILISACFVTALASNSINIDCHFFLSPFGKNSEIYQCDTKSLNVEAPSIVSNISGAHLDGKKNSDVERLKIENQVCHFMPSGFDSFFPNLKSLRIVSTGLKKISLQDLKPFPLLEFIEIYANDVSSLQTDIFSSTLRLTSINFQDNKINKIGRDLLAPLKHLRKAHFNGNLCISQRADEPDKIKDLQEKLNKEC